MRLTQFASVLAAAALAPAAAAAGDGIESRAVGANGAVSVARQLPVAGVELHGNIPLLGSLSRIYGTVTGLANPAAHRLCVYLESTQSGASLFNGPKPAEDDGSFSPINAAGEFSYPGWWAHPTYDVVTPFVFLFVVQNDYNGGRCNPVVGGPAMPPQMLDAAVAWQRYVRISPFTMDATLPALGTAGPITGWVAGMPEAIGQYRILVYGRGGQLGGWTGPLAACGATFPLAADPAVPGRATFTLATWAQDCPQCASATQLAVLLVPNALDASYDPHGLNAPVCVENVAGDALPPGVRGPIIISVTRDRQEAAQPPAPATDTGSATGGATTGTGAGAGTATEGGAEGTPTDGGAAAAASPSASPSPPIEIELPGTGGTGTGTGAAPGGGGDDQAADGEAEGSAASGAGSTSGSGSDSTTTGSGAEGSTLLRSAAAAAFFTAAGLAAVAL